MSGSHAFLPPSGAAIWVKCAAAPSMWQRYPEPEDSLESMEGTAAHWAFEQLFAGQNIDVGLLAPNGVVLTDEMCEGAELFYDTVMEDHRGPHHVELRIDIPRVHLSNWGTPDLFNWGTTVAGRGLPEEMVLRIYDYKFGHGYVDEFENWQLIDYAAGLIGDDDTHVTVQLTIVQPRCYHRDGPVRRLTVRASELRAQINILRAAAEAAHEPNPIATVNPKCKHCSGRHACETYQRTALEAADLSMRSVPLDLTPQALGLELSMLKRAQAALDGRISGLEQSVEAAVKQGQRVPGWSIEYTNGRQAWMVPTDEVVALGEMMQVDLSKKAVVTPKQAVKAGLDPALVDAYSFFPPGSPKLVPDNLSTLRKVFQK